MAQTTQWTSVLSVIRGTITPLRQQPSRQAPVLYEQSKLTTEHYSGHHSSGHRD